MRVVLFVNIEGAQKLFVRYLSGPQNKCVTNISCHQGRYYPGRSNVTSIEEVET